MMTRVYTVYKGERGGKLVYIGTTVQRPGDRFRWHRNNGTDLDFTILCQYDNADDMLDEEYRLIQKHKPSMNKIKHRRQNLNIKLTEAELNKRKGNNEWCQVCLKRRVKGNFLACFFCSK